jgi:hypothetical protein
MLLACRARRVQGRCFTCLATVSEMIAAYLYVNAALYAVFALWCTFQYQATSRNLGYLTLDNSGKSEYLVIYGGLQWALAASFLYLASAPELRALGLRFAFAVYLPIVAYRVLTLWRFSPVRKMTRWVAALEVLLLLAGLALFWLMTA